jgi:hypothetical protein
MRGNMGGKLFAVVVILIALASAVPIINHTFLGATVAPPEDISTHGADIDKQLDETMIEAGLSFLTAQLVLGFLLSALSLPGPGGQRPPLLGIHRRLSGSSDSRAQVHHLLRIVHGSRRAHLSLQPYI